MEKKFKFKRKLKGLLITSVVTASIVTSTIYSANTVATLNNYQQNPQNQIFEKEKIIQDISYFGGDIRYIDDNFNIFNLLTKNKTDYCNHLKAKNTEYIIGYDESTVTPEVAKQFDYVIEHINYLFSIINPNYKFKTGFYSQKDCDIYIDFRNIPKLIFDNDSENIGAYVNLKFNNQNKSQVESAKIHFNKNMEFITPQLRYFLLHEMMHILYGSKDIDYTQSETFSIYNYNDINFIISQISWAFESVEDYKNSVYKPLDPNIVQLYTSGLKPFLPLLTVEEKNSFVSLLPTDVSTLIAIYGDSSKIENKKAYINLLNEILEKNKKVFDIDYSVYGENLPKTSQYYYKDDFMLPEL